MHGRGPSNEMRPQLQLKKAKVRLYKPFIVYSNKRCYKRCTLLTRWNTIHAIDIMYGHGLSSKMHPQLQPKKTKVRLN